MHTDELRVPHCSISYTFLIAANGDLVGQVRAEMFKGNLLTTTHGLLHSFFLGELGDGLNIFQGIYLVTLGWNEGSVGVALSLMGFTALIVQTIAGDVIDKPRLDRRKFLSLASLATALSASAILLVQEGNGDRMLIYSTKIVEGISSSFIGPCVAALTLAQFGPARFDDVMAGNILWGHVGSIASAVLAGLTGYYMYPDIKYCFLVIGFSALCAVGGVQLLEEGDALMGRGLQTQAAGTLDASVVAGDRQNAEDSKTGYVNADQSMAVEAEKNVASYWSVFGDRKTIVLCFTGFFFHFANANVLLVLGVSTRLPGCESNRTVNQHNPHLCCIHRS